MTHFFVSHFNIDPLDFLERVAEILHPMPPFTLCSTSLVSRSLD
jgi:hypothetical protein